MLLVGGLATGGVVVAGGVAVATGAVPVPARIRSLFQDPTSTDGIPDAPEGQVRLQQVHSAARGRTVGLWTAVPEGHGDGAGLPVCLVLHGASATTADYSRFGLARFLTAAVRAGTPPFVLAGTDGGHTFWTGDGAADDPQRMLTEELPKWCAQRGFDATRLAAYGWSMGGFGALLAAERNPGLLRSVSALSPAVRSGDEVTSGVGRLVGARTAVWCGRSDPLFPEVQALAAAIPGGAAVTGWGPGAHTRIFWNGVTPAAYEFAGRALAAAAH